MTRVPGKDERELERLRREAAERERRADALIAQLRSEAGLREHDLAELRERLGAVEHELEDLRAIRDALTPPELPERPGVDLAATYVPAAKHVGGDFNLVAEGPQDATILVVGDVVGHGLPAACVTYLPGEERLRWAYAGHPPALRLDGPKELTVTQQGAPLGILADPACVEGSCRSPSSAGMLPYTDALTEARRGRKFFGLDGVTTALRDLRNPSPAEAVNTLRARVAEFALDALSDDLCLLAARFN
jgi:sigma-B regulation protein RsbU (phosphoserine phosphatase)